MPPTTIRVEQWSAAQAQDSIPAVGQDGCVRELPFLMHALKTAAVPDKEGEPATAAAPEGVSAAPSAAQDCADASARRGPTSQDSTETVLHATGLHASKSGGHSNRMNLQPISMKRGGSRGQKGGHAHLPDSPATPCSCLVGTLPHAAMLKFVHKSRLELIKLEESIPWEAVHESWKDIRTSWRKRTRGAESVAELTHSMRELRHALGVENSPFSSYGGSWDRLWARCSQGGASLEELGQLLQELKVNAKRWVKVKPHSPAKIGEVHWALARRGFQALHRAMQLCGPAGAHQCPLEAILEYDPDALRAVRELVVKEMSLPGSTCFLAEKSVRVEPETIFSAVERSRRPDNEQWQNKAYGMSSSGETASEMMLS